MNKPIFTLLMAAVALSAPAQSKLDASARRVMDEYSMMQDANDGARTRIRSRAAAATVAAAQQDRRQTMLLLVNDDAAASDLEAAGCEVIDLGDGIALVRASLDAVPAIEALDCVRAISFGGRQRASMNETRVTTGADIIHAGDPTNEVNPYTGKDVLLGLIDIGFDINHLNFLDSEGKTRFEYFWHMLADNGSHLKYGTPEELAEFTSDDREYNHATHTSGIAAGGYRGPIDYYDGVNDEDVYDAPNPFYGMAPDARLIGSGGQLYDANIEMGMYVMSEYAKKQSKPLVLNMSFGSNLGPHDGTSAKSKAVTKYAKGNFFVVSAGNEGGTNISVAKTLTADDNTMRTLLSFNDWNRDGNEASAELYSNDATPFELTLAVVDFNGNILCEVPVDLNSGTNTVMTTSYYSGAGDNYFVEQAMNDGFYNGCYVSALPMVDPASGRFMVSLQHVLIRSSANYYYIGLIAKGSDGQRINGYTESTAEWFTNGGFSGWTNGSNDGSLSDIATADGIITVGAYTGKDHVWAYDGSLIDKSSAVFNNDIAYFSSFGTMPDGSTRPHVCAPGVVIVSSVNRYMGVGPFTGDDKYYNPGDSKYTARSGNHLWLQESGTSMSAPVVSGIIALWLEAYPLLTYKQVMDILEKTSIRDEYTDANPARWGFGKIDAVAGLKEVLKLNSVINTAVSDTDDNMRMLVSADGDRRYEVFVNGEQGLTATLTAMSGANVLTAASDGDTVTVDASALTPGIYVLAVKGTDTTYTRKLVIR